MYSAAPTVLVILLSIWTPNVNSENWYPLQPGNYWVYHESDGDQSRWEVDGPIEVENTPVFAIKRKALKGLFADQESYQTDWVRWDDETLKQYGKQALGHTYHYLTPITWISTELTTGSEWTDEVSYNFRQENIRLSRTSIIETEEPVTVPAGTFQALRIKVTIGYLQWTQWYARGIGMVKEHYKSRFSERTKELAQYHIQHSG